MTTFRYYILPFFALFLLFTLKGVPAHAQKAKTFSVDNNVEVISASKNEPYIDFIANFLRDDIQKIFGAPTLPKTTKKIILRIVNDKTAGVSGDALKSIDNSLQNKWEVFSYKHYVKNNTNYLIISGSDKRGLAYGVFDLSEKLGVSPWYFWADVPIKTKSSAISVSDTLSNPPSVKYRGIFINDEDWGLQPWAAKTFETDKQDIGPKTYAKVFELLLRLKANLIWPAMHPSTKAFYFYPENKEVARQYAIVVGTSHAEPMMRNNVYEWVDSTMGEYNYVTNKGKILDYWKTRIDEIKAYENLYSIGMRGKHDSGMAGTKSTEEAVALTNTIINDERKLLSERLAKPANKINQVLTLYKEVLELYKSGLEVPDDVTLIWPDDNYGYIRNLSNEAERKRTGGAGVYYHASYWGRPHDYLWIGSTDPALLRFEMQKAYELEANKVWVINVGDIKAIEYQTQLFLDMAYNMQPFLKNEPVLNHLETWTLKNLGDKNIGKLLAKNYELAFIRKPEFMGWSKVEPTTQTNPTAFSIAEIEERLNEFQELEKQVNDNLPRDNAYESSYFQLVKYPILAASKMNQKFLNLDLYYTIKPELRTDTNSNFQKALAAYNDIERLTAEYNDKISDGKWKHIMSMHPRNLNVYKSPLELKNVRQKIVSEPKSTTISIPAGNYERISSTANTRWEKLPEPGFSKNVLVSKPFTLTKPLENDDRNQTWVEYEIKLDTTATYTINVQAVPLHPLNRSLGQKIAVRISDSPYQILDFETFDRSDEWKENVLSNKTIKSMTPVKLQRGQHTIRIKMIDPGVLIDTILLSR